MAIPAAKPSCPKCGNMTFEMQDLHVTEMEFRRSAINCTKCGAIIDTVDYFNTPALLHKLAAALKVSIP